MRVNLSTIFKKIVFSTNSPTVNTYEIKETPSGFDFEGKCREIYDGIGKAQCDYCKENHCTDNYVLFVITEKYKEKILVCVFQVLCHILQCSSIMIPAVHESFRQTLKIHSTTGKPVVL